MAVQSEPHQQELEDSRRRSCSHLERGGRGQGSAERSRVCAGRDNDGWVFVARSQAGDLGKLLVSVGKVRKFAFPKGACETAEVRVLPPVILTTSGKHVHLEKHFASLPARCATALCARAPLRPGTCLSPSQQPAILSSGPLHDPGSACFSFLCALSRSSSWLEPFTVGCSRHRGNTEPAAEHWDSITQPLMFDRDRCVLALFPCPALPLFQGVCVRLYLRVRVVECLVLDEDVLTATRECCSAQGNVM